MTQNPLVQSTLLICTNGLQAEPASKGEHLKTPDGTLAVADGGTTPKSTTAGCGTSPSPATTTTTST